MEEEVSKQKDAVSEQGELWKKRYANKEML